MRGDRGQAVLLAEGTRLGIGLAVEARELNAVIAHLGKALEGSLKVRQTIERRRSKESHRRSRQDCQYRDVRLHLIYNIENALPKESAFLFIAVSF